MSAVALPFVDFDGVPFSVPNSRFLVVTQPEGLLVYWIRYEVPLRHCIVIHGLTIADAQGKVVTVTAVRGGHVEFSDASVLSIFEDTVSLEVTPGSTFKFSDKLKTDGSPIEIRNTDTRLVLTASQAPSHDQVVAGADRLVNEWMAKSPVAQDPARQAMVDQCWWVLGINTLTLETEHPMRVVVPSKRGYVGHWQWDAYFIAVGLSHGDIDLAVEQMDVALKFQTDEGLLPDVVHENGVLASSADLPESDRVNLRETGYDTEAAPIPLTKPPLTAWAAGRVLEKVEQGAGLARREALQQEWYPAIEKAANWWFDHSDSDGDGVPEYSHPYSSGLDDSPVFDYGAPVETPDLTAYLAFQDHILASVNTGDKAQRYADRSAKMRNRLTERWDGDKRMFVSVREGKTLFDRTVVSLLGVVAPGLSQEIVAGVVAEIEDPARFGAPYGIPTVSLDDPKYDRVDMWRGPIWINTAYLVADGLERNGQPEVARKIRTQILDLIEHAHGPSEYYIPEQGIPSPQAVRCFAWSAALYIDLAVSKD